MAAIKFPCSACSKLMAVNEEYAGKKVRCPHCQQVVIAGMATTGDDAFDFDRLADSTAQSKPSPFGDIANSPAAFDGDERDFAPAAQMTPTFDEPSEPAPRVARSISPASNARAAWLLGILAPYAIF